MLEVKSIAKGCLLSEEGQIVNEKELIIILKGRVKIYKRRADQLPVKKENLFDLVEKK